MIKDSRKKKLFKDRMKQKIKQKRISVTPQKWTLEKTTIAQTKSNVFTMKKFKQSQKQNLLSHSLESFCKIKNRFFTKDSKKSLTSQKIRNESEILHYIRKIKAKKKEDSLNPQNSPFKSKHQIKINNKSLKFYKKQSPQESIFCTIYSGHETLKIIKKRNKTQQNPFNQRTMQMKKYKDLSIEQIMHDDESLHEPQKKINKPLDKTIVDQLRKKFLG